MMKNTTNILPEIYSFSESITDREIKCREHIQDFFEFETCLAKAAEKNDFPEQLLKIIGRTEKTDYYIDITCDTLIF